MKKLVCIVFLLFTYSAKAQSTAESYIENYKNAAIHIMEEHGIPASITLAIAIHESASGTSILAQKLNNHFGIKGAGGSYYHKKKKKIKSAYKKYGTVGDAYEDFARLLIERKAFSHLAERLSHYDYKGWARGIQRGGYAQNRAWSSQIMQIIHKYQLYAYDGRPANDLELVPVNNADPVEVAPIVSIYRVKKGDNLSVIAKKFKTSAKALQNKNGLKSTHLKIGQKLKI